MSAAFSTISRLAVGSLLSAFLMACSDSSSDRPTTPPPEVVPPEPELTYEAEVLWTEYGVPHVSGDDWGSLGYGLAYAYAEDNYCVVMKEYVRAAGESARYLGDEGSINEDLVYKLFNDDERIQRMLDEDIPAFIIELLEGYVAGLNRYLADTGVDNLAEGGEGCRSAQWVREVDIMDAVRLLHKSVLRGSSGPLVDFTVAAGPGDAMAKLIPVSQAAELLAGLDSEKVSAALDLPQGWEVGSNAYGVGEQGAQGNSGILFGNPHFPWQGPERFYMFHLTMGDEYDVMGAGLHGVPVPVIGFSQNVAWSHTVSTGKRFTLYELTLNPDNPMEYDYNGEFREFETTTVSAEQLGAGGAVEAVEHTFYFSHYGPILDLGSISPLLGGWPNAIGTLLTYRDANLENLRGLEQWVRMGQAGDMEEFKEALRPIGIPWVNTIAAGRDGNAFYGDISAVPNVSINQYDSCIRGPVQTLLTDFGLVTMDGSDPDCEWGSDEGTAEGVFGYDSLPKLETREYGANANDSYWLANPRQLLEGFSPVIGRERVEQTWRTRHTFYMADLRLQGLDGLGDGVPGFSIDTVRDMHYQATNFVARDMADDVADICLETADWSVYSNDPAAMMQACEVLRDWDESHRLDSVGAHVFFEFWLAVRDTENLWSVPFDPARPVITPTVISLEPEVLAATRQALATAVAKLSAAEIPLDRPWGEVQYVEKNGVRHGIHGGSSSMMFSVITSELVDGEGYSNIRHGNSYMQAVTWDESDCPDAFTMLTYSQSTDPESNHYADATELYSNGGWIDAPFCRAAQEEQEIRRETISE